MPKTKQIPNLTLSAYNDIFASTVETVPASDINGNRHSTIGISSDISGERVLDLPITQLHPPEFHPFQVNDDAEMDRLVKNIKKYGVREPGLARARCDKNGNPDGYELLCGNRRKRACELAGLETMPVIIRELDDDSAAIAMVDSNLEKRDKLLLSEKAWAYRVKLEALNHQGVKSDNPGQLSVDILCEQTGESKTQVFRLIRLTELVVDLIDKVDARQLAFNPAVELSYLSQAEQAAVASAMEHHDVKPSLSQATRLKKLKQARELTPDKIDVILSEAKKEPRGGGKEISRFSEFFPKGYTVEQMCDVISDLLRGWQSEVALSESA